MSPCNSLGQTCNGGAQTQSTVTGALIGTYCTANNYAASGLSDVGTDYTGDFITIDGKL